MLSLIALQNYMCACAYFLFLKKRKRKILRLVGMVQLQNSEYNLLFTIASFFFLFISSFFLLCWTNARINGQAAVLFVCMHASFIYGYLFMLAMLFSVPQNNKVLCSISVFIYFIHFFFDAALLCLCTSIPSKIILYCTFLLNTFFFLV